MSDLEANLNRIRRRIAAAAERAGRSAEDVTLVAVSKTQPAEAVVSAFRLGLRHFGENRVEEAEEKIPLVRSALSDEATASSLTWHMVGHLQSRKAGTAAGLFQMLHSLDSVKLARKLSRLCVESGRVMPVLLETNVSGEQSKYGFSYHPGIDEPEQLSALLAAVEQMLGLPGIEVHGLMTMAPIVSDPEQARPVFRRLRSLRDEFAGRFPDGDWRHLSMGMTDDFEVAVEEGATIVRVGRAIFGPRRQG
jgi:pyridoxal phosphate enzyme (YggS family)